MGSCVCGPVLNLPGCGGSCPGVGGGRRGDEEKEEDITEPEANIIPVRPPPHHAPEKITTVRHTVRRDKGLVQALSIPAINLYNMPYIWSKISNLAKDIRM